MTRPPLDEAVVNARIERLEAENRTLLSQLMAARAQLEYVLTTLRMTYESVRSEQTRLIDEGTE